MNSCRKTTKENLMDSSFRNVRRDRNYKKWDRNVDGGNDDVDHLKPNKYTNNNLSSELKKVFDRSHSRNELHSFQKKSVRQINLMEEISCHQRSQRKSAGRLQQRSSCQARIRRTPTSGYFCRDHAAHGDSNFMQPHETSKFITAGFNSKANNAHTVQPAYNITNSLRYRLLDGCIKKSSSSFCDVRDVRNIKQYGDGYEDDEDIFASGNLDSNAPLPEYHVEPTADTVLRVANRSIICKSSSDLQ
ncbi:hypothetical protein HELRODRAFT_163988 [Helobdella robusta]|uniref:Uncharacterized protein n=1 Tax=Helobdella robusta TaxID=6412 RepID=T1EUQ5_HELRO|nr:hypothetical protein HELRODRAFT_163988 [Helobdella robusta]ESN94198.1 hypothetical protein HELRODRAFT_163988 [Helobdella robusta]